MKSIIQNRTAFKKDSNNNRLFFTFNKDDNINQNYKNVQPKFGLDGCCLNTNVGCTACFGCTYIFNISNDAFSEFTPMKGNFVVVNPCVDISTNIPNNWNYGANIESVSDDGSNYEIHLNINYFDCLSVSEEILGLYFFNPKYDPSNSCSDCRPADCKSCGGTPALPNDNWVGCCGPAAKCCGKILKCNCLKPCVNKPVLSGVYIGQYFVNNVSEDATFSWNSFTVDEKSIVKHGRKGSAFRNALAGWRKQRNCCDKHKRITQTIYKDIWSKLNNGCCDFDCNGNIKIHSGIQGRTRKPLIRSGMQPKKSCLTKNKKCENKYSYSYRQYQHINRCLSFERSQEKFTPFNDECKCLNQYRKGTCNDCTGCSDGSVHNKAKTIYKPNNKKFSKQGSVTSSGRLERLKLDTIRKANPKGNYVGGKPRYIDWRTNKNKNQNLNKYNQLPLGIPQLTRHKFSKVKKKDVDNSIIINNKSNPQQTFKFLNNWVYLNDNDEKLGQLGIFRVGKNGSKIELVNSEKTIAYIDLKQELDNWTRDASGRIMEHAHPIEIITNSQFGKGNEKISAIKISQNGDLNDGNTEMYVNTNGIMYFHLAQKVNDINAFFDIKLEIKDDDSALMSFKGYFHSDVNKQYGNLANVLLYSFWSTKLASEFLGYDVNIVSPVQNKELEFTVKIPKDKPLKGIEKDGKWTGIADTGLMFERTENGLKAQLKKTTITINLKKSPPEIIYLITDEDDKDVNNEPDIKSYSISNKGIFYKSNSTGSAADDKMQIVYNDGATIEYKKTNNVHGLKIKASAPRYDLPLFIIDGDLLSDDFNKITNEKNKNEILSAKERFERVPHGRDYDNDMPKYIDIFD